MSRLTHMLETIVREKGKEFEFLITNFEGVRVTVTPTRVSVKTNDVAKITPATAVLLSRVASLPVTQSLRGIVVNGQVKLKDNRKKVVAIV